jgi:5-methylcytosine-specific restriction endonuclease McrA
MILVKAAPEPLDFNEKVRKPGLDAIAELVGEKPDRTRRGRKREKVADRREDIPSKRFPPFWRNILPEMLEAYESRCAYLALHIEHSTGNPTVDHFIPQSKDWRQVYEWRNYRLAAGLINSKKRELDISLDPFEIEPG